MIVMFDFDPSPPSITGQLLHDPVELIVRSVAIDIEPSGDVS